MVERFRPGGSGPEGKFRKGLPRPENAGRRAGTPNKSTTLLKDALTGSGAVLGWMEPIYNVVVVRNPKTGKPLKLKNGKEKLRPGNKIIGWKPGKGGMQGYLIWLGIHHPKSYATLLGKLLPLQVEATVRNDASIPERFKASDLRNMSTQEKIARMKEMIGATKLLPEMPKGAPIVDAEFSEVTKEAAE